MRLLEIVNTTTNNRQMKVPFNLRSMGAKSLTAFQNANPEDGEEPVGSGDDEGTYASGKENPRDPHLYRKRTYLPSRLHLDAYHTYIMACKDHMGSNPFLPRVYNVLIKKDVNGMTQPTYDMEKLRSVASIKWTKETALALVESCMDDVKYIDPNITRDLDTNPMDAVENMIWMLAEYLMGGYGLGAGVEWKDGLKQLKELIQHIRSENPQFGSDLHTQNFMIRTTQVGYQLVITDPLTDHYRSVVRP